MILTKDDIAQFEQRYRTAFVNSLAGFRQAVLVGTKSQDNNPNLAIFNSLIHLGANPALLGLINRPDSVQRDTLQNIIETKEYTARYDKGISEFEKVGFEELYQPFCLAPFVKDAVVSIAMKLEEIIPIQINGTVLIVGSIKQVVIASELIEADGFVALSNDDVLISQGLDAYFVSRPIGRLPYAKP